ncbi:MAG: hypothetical protein ACREBT_01435 [Thermoplasmata archaeon]
MSAALANGTFSYAISDYAGYHQTSLAYSGSGSISGHSVAETELVFSVYAAYTVTFSETGLPASSSWSVTINGTLYTSVTGSDVVSAALANGTFSYAISDYAGYHQTSLAYSGSGSISGHSVVETGLVFSVYAAYTVTFTEAGITFSGGVEWNVTLNGLTQCSSTSTIPFTGQGNGTYGYSVNSPGWQPSPTSGSVTVSGSNVTGPEITFTQVTYSVTFSESGLPVSTSWSVTLNGVRMSTGSSITFTGLTNGTYSYTIADVPGWHLASGSYSGSVGVSGGNPTVLLTFTEWAAYSVEFTEIGLPVSTTWSVTLNGTLSSTASSITFTGLTNGTYSYTIADVPGWHLSSGSYSGSEGVDGGSQTVPLTFTEWTVYSAEFTETGLPVGTSWSVTLNGTLSSTGSSITFTELANGTYSYTIGDVPGWHLSSGSYTGSVSVTGASPPVLAVIFSPMTYTITITQTGLPTDTDWSITLGSTRLSSTGSLISIPEPNGTYAYTVTDVPGWHLSTGNYTGRVLVAGNTPATVALAFVQVTYAVTFRASGLSGVIWGVNVSGTFESAVAPASITFQLANGSSTYTITNVPGWRANLYHGSVAIVGASTAVSTTWSQVIYTVKFTESGLPAGTYWSVVFNGTMNVAVAPNSIGFSSPNGTYPFSVLYEAGWRPSQSSGPVRVQGSDVSVPITWTQMLYAVTFSETGLPSTTWSVSLEGNLRSAVAPDSIVFEVPNGSYQFTIPTVAGYVEEPTSGQFSVVGSSIVEAIAFNALAPGHYTVTFLSAGLVTGTVWSATLNGTSKTSSGSTIVFVEPDGNYHYTIGTLAGWTAQPNNGGLTVVGSNLTVSIQWNVTTYDVQFVQSGFTAGRWYVELGAVTESALAEGTITFTVANGTYNWSVSIPTGWRADPAQGALTVLGAAPATIEIVFSRVVYSVAFTEQGLPAGTNWSMTVNGTAYSARSGFPIVASLQNGSFLYTITDVPGYHQTTLPYSGGGLIEGGPVTEPTLIFTVYAPYVVTFVESGLPGGSGRTWGVTLRGYFYASPTGLPIVSLGLPNGTFSYTIADEPGYHQTTLPYSGSVSVAGASLNLPTLDFVPFSEYTVTFLEAGLPTGVGQTWSVSVNGITYSEPTSQSIVSAELSNGSYSWTIHDFAGYHQFLLPYSGVGTIDGQSVTAGPIQFSLLLYPVTFVETGLPTGAKWNLTLAGERLSSAAPAITFYAPNGTSAYAVDILGHWYPTPNVGSALVNGAPQTIDLEFFFSSAITFTQTGLTAGQQWGVIVTRTSSNATSSGAELATRDSSTTYNTTETSVTIHLANGSYQFVIIEADGYFASPPVGSFVAAGDTVIQAVVYTKPAVYPSSSDWFWWFVVLTASLITLGLVTWIRRRGGSGAARPRRAPARAWSQHS